MTQTSSKYKFSETLWMTLLWPESLSGCFLSLKARQRSHPPHRFTQPKATSSSSVDRFSSKLSQILLDSQTPSGLLNSHDSGHFFLFFFFSPSGAVSLPPSFIPPSPPSPSWCRGEPLPLYAVVIWQEIFERRRCANCPEISAVRSRRRRGPTPASY